MNFGSLFILYNWHYCIWLHTWQFHYGTSIRIYTSYNSSTLGPCRLMRNNLNKEHKYIILFYFLYQEIFKSWFNNMLIHLYDFHEVDCMVASYWCHALGQTKLRQNDPRCFLTFAPPFLHLIFQPMHFYSCVMNIMFWRLCCTMPSTYVAPCHQRKQSCRLNNSSSYERKYGNSNSRICKLWFPIMLKMFVSAPKF